MAKKPQIETIRSKLFSRGASLLKVGVKAGSMAAGEAIRNVFRSDEDQKNGWAPYVSKQIGLLAEELGQLKGSAMKVGQLLSTYGEHFFPPEANAILKQLQFQSPPLAWEKVESQLIRELGKEKLLEIEIDDTPVAAASIGQVYRARRKSDGVLMALKVQYPGVEGAIETDLKFLKSLLSIGPLLPKGPKFDNIFDEVRTMLYREMNYHNEIEATERMANYLEGDSRYRVAKVYKEFSTQKIIATEFLEGSLLDSSTVSSLSQERRNRLGEAYLELYMKELFEFQFVQTDPHLGNYRVAVDKRGADKDQLILFDFGAMREVPSSFLFHFSQVLKGALELDRDRIIRAGMGLNILKSDDPPELLQHYVDLCLMITEPFESTKTIYDWGQSNLPQRVAKKGKEIVFGYSLRSPPQETVFLDRKMGGAFVILALLKCQISTRSLVSRYLENYLERISP